MFRTETVTEHGWLRKQVEDTIKRVESYPKWLMELYKQEEDKFKHVQN